MSNQFEFINENAITNLFQSYLQAMKVGDAFDQILDDLIDEEFSEAETLYVVHETLIPEVISLFAEKYFQLDEVYSYDPSEDHLNAIFETFCTFEHVSRDLANLLAATMNDHAATEDDDEDDSAVIFKPGDWDELSDDERKAKVKAFLKKLAKVHLDARDQKPFLKNLDVGEAISFPNASNQGHDDLHRGHPLHKTCLQHGFEYRHTTPVAQNNGSVLHHHTWSNPAGHLIGAYEGDTAWSSKVSPTSGHVHTGIGAVALDKHLKSKAKRYKLQNNESKQLPTTPILESLLDPESIDRVQRYADFMNKNPATIFGHQINETSPADELRKAWKMKEENEKRFGVGKDQADWGLFDYRSGKPK